MWPPSLLLGAPTKRVGAPSKRVGAPSKRLGAPSKRLRAPTEILAPTSYKFRVAVSRKKFTSPEIREAYTTKLWVKLGNSSY